MDKALKRRTRKPLLIATLVLVVLFAALPTALLLVIGFAPTLGARIGDTAPGKYLTKCVAWMNLAGVAPFLFDLWLRGNDMVTAIAIVTDMFAWLAMYGAAGMGWLLFLGLPGVVAMFRSLNANRRIYVLRERQKELINEWGEVILPAGQRTKAAAGGKAYGRGGSGGGNVGDNAGRDASTRPNAGEAADGRVPQPTGPV